MAIPSDQKLREEFDDPLNDFGTCCEPRFAAYVAPEVMETKGTSTWTKAYAFSVDKTPKTVPSNPTNSQTPPRPENGSR